MNVHWMILYNLKVFYSDMKFKMAATAGLSLTLDPMGKMWEEDLWNFSQSEHIIGPSSHIEYPTGTKNSNFVEDHPRNILNVGFINMTCTGTGQKPPDKKPPNNDEK
jgi:hypothetical protein